MNKKEQRLIIAENLRILLKQNNKKRTDVASDLKISYSTVSDWARGRTAPNAGQVKMLADYFKVTIGDITNRSDDYDSRSDSEILDSKVRVPVLTNVQSTEDGGTNEFTVTLTNGTKYVLTNKNGSKGNKGDTGPAVPLVQTTGTSTTSAMSQKAVTDSLDSLKSDLVAKSDSLSLEEIMASTDLTNKVASASALKDTFIVPNYSDSNSITVTELTTEGGSWTAPSNGVIRIYGVKNDDGLISEITITINNNINNDIRYMCSGGTILYCTQYIPLKKGDILVTHKYINIYSGGTPIFFPSI